MAWMRGAALAALSLLTAAAGAQEQPLGPSSKGLGLAQFEARGLGPGAKVQLWVRNGRQSDMVEAQAKAVGLDKDGKAVFEARAQWRGQLGPGERATMAAVALDAPGLDLKPVAKIRIEPSLARYVDGKESGAPAPWSLSRAQERQAQASLGPALDGDLRRAEAFGKGERPKLAAAAALWAPKGKNPYDPASGLWIVFGWRAHEAAASRGAKATFYRSGAGAPFLKAAVEARRDLAPKAEGFAWVGAAFPGASREQAAAFELAARGHGVDVERVHVKEEAGPR